MYKLPRFWSVLEPPLPYHSSVYDLKDQLRLGAATAAAATSAKQLTKPLGPRLILSPFCGFSLAQPGLLAHADALAYATRAAVDAAKAGFMLEMPRMLAEKYTAEY